MNRRKFRKETVRQNEILIGIRKLEAENADYFRKVREKEYKLQKERLFLERHGMEMRTKDLKTELKGIYKHCIAEVNKESESLEEQIEKAEVKIKELEENIKQN